MIEPERMRRTNRTDAYRVAHEFKRLAAKLRWIGDDEDAARVEEALAKVAPREFVLMLVEDTD